MTINQNFVRTSDPDTAEQLRNAGLYEVQNTGSNYFTFVNPGKMNFESKGIDVSKISYTNKLNI